MVLSQWRKLGSNWSVVFTLGVALYLVISTIDIKANMPFVDASSQQPSGNSEEESAFLGDSSTSSTNPEKSSNTTSTNSKKRLTAASWHAEIVSFRIEPDKKNIGNFNAMISLEITNDSDQNIKIYPEELRLAPAGSASSPPKSNTSAVTISPQLPVIVPVTFAVDPRAGATYELTYQGQTIYSGKPA